jgi:hypothetical protein
MKWELLTVVKTWVHLVD